MVESGLGQQRQSCSQAQVTPCPQDVTVLLVSPVHELGSSRARLPHSQSLLVCTARPHSCGDTLCPQTGQCTHTPGALCFAFPPALEKGSPTWHFPGAGEQTLLGASSQK